MRIGVIGAGSWGTTLANMLVLNEHAVRLWCFEEEVVTAIGSERVNSLYLPGCALANELEPTASMAQAVNGAEMLVMAVPSHAFRAVAGQAAEALAGETSVPVVSVSKGLEPGSHYTMTAVVEEELGCPAAALSGPSFAKEVYQQMPTAVVAASQDPVAADLAQRAFSNSFFRVYTSGDELGVQLGGALKNVVAIAAGIVDGMEMGHNTRAALITRGLAETTRLGEVMGADPKTFAGLAGMGDLILTATGGLSRNRSLGIALGKGRSMHEALSGKRTVAEGVNTAKVAVDIGNQTGVELPIAEQVAAILFEDKTPQEAIRDLMERDLKAEHWR